MARSIYQGVTKDQNGRVLFSCTVSVYLAGTSTPASIYAASAGGVAVNSVTSSAADGTFSFWVDITDYDFTQLFDVVTSKTNYGSVTYSSVSIFTESVLDRNVYWIGDYANLAAALTDIGATPATLFIDRSTTLSASATVPSTLSLVFLKGGMIVKAAAYTMTINGPLSAGLFQIFSGFTSVTLGGFYVDEVYPEWWGAVAHSTKAASTDCTAAINAALATGKNVKLQNGYYGTTGGHAISFEGQKFLGSGARIADDNGGTYLYKLSGVSVVLAVGAYYGVEVGDFTIDAHNLAGNCMTFAAIYSHARDIYFLNQGGTDYPFALNDWNCCSFDRLYFGVGYGGVCLTRSTGAGYSSFNGFVIACTSGDAVWVKDKNTSIIFNELYVEAPIVVEGNVANIQFNNLSCEWAVNNTDPIVSISGAGIKRAVMIDGFNASISVATTHPLIEAVSAYGLSVRDVYVYDSANAIGKSLITLDGCQGVKLSNLQAYMANTFNWVLGKTNRSDYVTAENVTYTSGAVGTCSWYSAYLSLKTSNCNQSFAAASSQIYMDNVWGTFTLTNAASWDFVRCTPAAFTPIAFTAADTSPSVKYGNLYSATNGSGCTITTFDEGTIGQVITIIFKDSNTTIAETDNIKLGGAFTGTADDTIRLVYDGTSWYELSRSVN